MPCSVLKVLTTSVGIVIRNGFRQQLSRLALLLFAQVAFFTEAFSQDYQQIGIGTGLDFRAIKSELISPYTHTGSTSPFQVFYRRENDRSRRLMQFSYSSLSLSSDGLSFTEDQGYLQYAYHRKVGIIIKRITFFGGLVAGMQGSHRNNQLNGLTVANNDATELVISLSPSVLLACLFL